MHDIIAHDEAEDIKKGVDGNVREGFFVIMEISTNFLQSRPGLDVGVHPDGIRDKQGCVGGYREGNKFGFQLERAFEVGMLATGNDL